MRRGHRLHLIPDSRTNGCIAANFAGEKYVFPEGVLAGIGSIVVHVNGNTPESLGRFSLR